MATIIITHATDHCTAHSSLPISFKYALHPFLNLPICIHLFAHPHKQLLDDSHWNASHVLQWHLLLCLSVWQLSIRLEQPFSTGITQTTLGSKQDAHSTSLFSKPQQKHLTEAIHPTNPVSSQQHCTLEAAHLTHNSCNHRHKTTQNYRVKTQKMNWAHSIHNAFLQYDCEINRTVFVFPTAFRRTVYSLCSHFLLFSMVVPSSDFLLPLSVFSFS